MENKRPRPNNLINILSSIDEEGYEQIKERMFTAIWIGTMLKIRNISDSEFAELLQRDEEFTRELLAGNIDFDDELLAKIQGVFEAEC